MTAPPAPRPGRRLDQGPNGQLVGSSTTPLDDLIIYHRERQLPCLPGSGLGCGLLHVLPRVLVNLQELRAVDSPVCSTATCGTCSTIKRKVRLQRNTQRPHSLGQTSRLLHPPIEHPVWMSPSLLACDLPLANLPAPWQHPALAPDLLCNTGILIPVRAFPCCTRHHGVMRTHTTATSAVANLLRLSRRSYCCSPSLPPSLHCCCRRFQGLQQPSQSPS